MSHNRRSASARSPEASQMDLANVLARVQATAPFAMAAFASSEAKGPPQAPPFLAHLPADGVAYAPQQPATQHLKKIIEENYYAGNFEMAIARVAEQNIPELSRIRSLDQFYFYIDALVTWIPEIRVWDWDGDVLHERTVYLRITQFYYYFNQPELEALQSPIAPLEGEQLSPVSLWLREFAIDWGAFLDTPASCQYLESFKYAPEYGWQDYQKAPEDYDSFNAFFARQFREIDVQRPVAETSDDRVVVFPAESTYVGQWTVTTPVGEPLAAGPTIVVKHIEWSIGELLSDSEHAKDLEGGLFSHSFLNTYDYHRQHTPVRGTVLEAKFIPGQVYLEVNLQEQGSVVADGSIARAVIPERYLDADDPTGYQFVQCRGLLVLDSPIGKVAVLPMGMAQVSSVVFVDPATHEPIVLTPKERKDLDFHQQVALLNRKIHDALVGKTLEKGQMFSYFQFGGSDCVMVFERKANINVTAQVGVHYPIRSQFAVSNIDS